MTKIDDLIERAIGPIGMRDAKSFTSLRDIGWDAIRPMCDLLKSSPNLERQRDLIHLMKEIAESADGRSVGERGPPAPLDLPVDAIHKCLEKQVDEYSDLKMEEVRHQLVIDGSDLLKDINYPESIDILLPFIHSLTPAAEDEDEDRNISGCSVYAIQEITEKSSPSTLWLGGKRANTLLAGQPERIEQEMTRLIDSSDNVWVRRYALQCLVNLGHLQDVRFLEKIFDEDDYRARVEALRVFSNQWEPWMMPLVKSQIGLVDDTPLGREYGREDPDSYQREVVLTIAEGSGNNEISELIDWLQFYSTRKQQDKRPRDGIERALVRLRANSRSVVEDELRGASGSFRGSLRRVLSSMDDADQDN